MKWKKSASVLSLEAVDFEIMEQCKMSLGDIVNRNPPVPKLPPLWSVLSYAMLQNTSRNVSCVWLQYHKLIALAHNRDRSYYSARIPKNSGGIRTLAIPSFEIRQQQKFILEHILSALPTDEHAFAYRKNTGIKDCAVPHINREILIHLDIKDFFHSISEDMVFETLRHETGYSNSLCRLLAQLCCYKGHLPQGAATSPVLSNLVFRRCDAALARLADFLGMTYTRYSDDLFFSGDRHSRVDHLLREARRILRTHGFSINEEKTKVRKKQHRQSVLGLTVNEKLQVNRTYRRRLMQELYYLEQFGENCSGALECGDYMKYMQQLQGKLSYLLHIDPENTELQLAHLKLAWRIKHYNLFHTPDLA